MSKNGEKNVENDVENETGDEKNCNICFENYKTRVKCILPCSHVLCLNCILKLVKHECHICRSPYSNILPASLRHKHVKTFEEYDIM